MIKKVLLVVSIILLFIPFVKAEIVLDPLIDKEYNLGDQIQVSGYILINTNQLSDLKISLGCDANKIQLFSRFIDVKANKKFPFSEFLTIPQSANGKCNVIAEFLSDFSGTDFFDITKRLNGKFSIDPGDVQLGDSIKLIGTVTKLNNEKISGFVTVYVKQENNTFFSDQAKIEEGELNFLYTPSSILGGVYNIEILASDVYGNQFLFENAATLRIYDKLVVSASLDKLQLLPEDSITVSGVVKKQNAELADAIIKIKFDNSEFETTAVKGEFSKQFRINKDVKSKYHDVTVIATDVNGNSGEKKLQFYVNPIPTSIKNELDKNTYMPGEDIKIKVLLYDQGNELVEDNVLIQVYNPSNNKIYETTAAVNSEITYKISEFSDPGKYSIRSSSSNLEAENEFNLGSVKDLSITLNGQELLLKNIGNVKFDDVLEISAYKDGKTYIVRKNTNLNPSEELILYLYKDLNSGTYTLEIPYKSLKFENVNIIDERSFFEKIGDGLKQMTGGVVGVKGTTPSKTPLYVLLIIVLAMGILITIVRVKNKRFQDIKDARDYKEAKVLRKDIEEKAHEKKSTFGKATEDDIKDFKQQILKQVKPYTTPKITNTPKKVIVPPERQYTFERPAEKSEEKAEEKKEPSEVEKEREEKNKLFGIFD